MLFQLLPVQPVSKNTTCPTTRLWCCAVVIWTTVLPSVVCAVVAATGIVAQYAPMTEGLLAAAGHESGASVNVHAVGQVCTDQTPLTVFHVQPVMFTYCPGFRLCGASVLIVTRVPSEV